MKVESELKVQAYLDGELSSRQARKVAAWLEVDPEAKSLFEELKMAKSVLTGGETEAKLPDSREFYWSKIEREIQRLETIRPKPVPAFLVAWRKLLGPVAGAALIMFLTVYTFRMYEGAQGTTPHLAIVENLSEHTGAYSFRSQSQNMFVVWVYDRSQEGTAESEPADDQIDQ